jgi:hypothetical protein
MLKFVVSFGRLKESLHNIIRNLQQVYKTVIVNIGIVTAVFECSQFEFTDLEQSSCYCELSLKALDPRRCFSFSDEFKGESDGKGISRFYSLIG